MIGGAKGIGLGIDLGLVNQYNRTGSQSYIEPEVLDSLVGVWSAYGMTNDSPNRSTIKNKLSNKGGDFVISNAAFNLNSGFGFYTNFRDAGRAEIEVLGEQHWLIKKVTNVIPEPILIEANKFNRYGFLLRIKCSGIVNTTDVYTNAGGSKTFLQNGINIIDAKNEEVYSSGYIVFGIGNDATNIEIQILPEFEGAFVTDGIDDLITSTKTMQEMLGGSNEITVVSMIHQIGLGCRTNFICDKGSYWRCNEVANTGEGKTGIYGYSSTNISVNTPNIINNVLGDKVDYSVTGDRNDLTPSQFSVVGYISSSGEISYTSSVAWYWTIIANKVLTTDQINQVISYFNLDKTLKPDILCNTIKQGITNENHAEFGDKLIDFSGNGRDIQLNNIAWKGDSGIGKYEVDFLDSSIWNSSNSTITSSKIDCKNAISHIMLLYYSVGSKEYPDIPSFKVIKTGADIDYSYIDETGSPKSVRIVDGVNVLPASHNTLYSGSGRFCGFGNPGMGNSVTITQIPSHAGALCLDGVNDFGKVTGMPIYKDYTAIVCREFISDKTAPILSKAKEANNGAFAMEIIANPNLGNTALYSFGKDTPNIDIIQSKSISYQTKYIYNSKDIVPGNGIDYDTMWIGKLRDNHAWFVNAAIYSLMSFPYSMSEFLIERQLKKHKLGTLYQDMVEFRPVIKSSVELATKPTFVIRGTSTLLNAGDYIPENSELWVVITMNNVADRITKFVINGNTIDIPSSAYNPSTMKYGFPFTIDSKSPQKIGITIEQDENYVQWNPVVESNVPYKSLRYYNNVQGTGWKQFDVGEYLPIGSKVLIRIYLNGSVDELSGATSSQLKNIQIGRNGVAEYDINGAITSESPQKINITIDEYIRYEDIVQPYPFIINIYDSETNHIYTWGDKLKVGSKIVFKEWANNLLPEFYHGRFDIYQPNGIMTIELNKEYEIFKGFGFKTYNIWKFDDNEPKCILSPRLLRIPNSSYKILGYIPDISGHGNHGVINNSAYAGMSGANGYPNNFNNYRIVSGVTKTDNSIKVEKKLSGSGWFLSIPANTAVASMKLNIDGIPSNKTVKWATNVEGMGDITLTNGVNEIPAYTSSSVSGIYAIYSDLTGLSIQQIGEYEGAYCLDGVDDFVAIPTLSSGGKQVLMKVNWQNDYDVPGYMYDSNAGEYRNYIIKGNKEQIAYENASKTYIDGILNANLTSGDLKDITHNITSQFNNTSGIPYIGCRHSLENFLKMSLYDFMLFDNISTDDKIKELNDYVGIEAKVELPPYYWDAYGKTNLDEDRSTIQQRGVAVGNYDLTNTNFSYDKMSGFGGYEFAKFNSAEWININRKDGIEVIEKNGYSFTAKRVGTGQYFYDFQNRSTIVLNKSLTVKAVSNNNTYIRWEYKYRTAEKPDVDSTLLLVRQAMTPNVPITVTLPYKTEEEKAELGVTEGSDSYLFYFDPSDIPVNREYTVEMLPLYPNGLVYDGVTDYSENANIPALTDYTYVIKRENLNNNVNSATMYKGNKAGGGAFIVDYISSNGSQQYSYGNPTLLPLNENTIIYGTKTSYNGSALTVGSNTDENGLDIGHWSSNYKSMVFYKLILYPKTIPLLQINFLKNLMERDEIIDLTNPIFIQE